MTIATLCNLLDVHLDIRTEMYYVISELRIACCIDAWYYYYYHIQDNNILT